MDTQERLANETASSILKERREKLGLSIDDMARKTYIRRTYLEAIEAGAYHIIGDPVYVKGFVRNYAEGLGLSGSALLRQYNRDVSGLGTPQNAHVSGPRKQYEHPEVQDIGRRHMGKRPFNKVEWGIILIGLFCIVFFWVWLLYL